MKLCVTLVCTSLLLAGGAALAAGDDPNLGQVATKLVTDEMKLVEMRPNEHSRGGPIELPRPIVVQPLNHDVKGGLMPVGAGGITSGLSGAIPSGDQAGTRAVRQLIRRLG